MDSGPGSGSLRRKRERTVHCMDGGPRSGSGSLRRKRERTVYGAVPPLTYTGAIIGANSLDKICFCCVHFLCSHKVGGFASSPHSRFSDLYCVSVFLRGFRQVFGVWEGPGKSGNQFFVSRNRVFIIRSSFENIKKSSFCTIGKRS